MNIWQILEITPTRDVSAIKQAYAKKIRVCKPETDPEGFQALRLAYEEATKYAEGHAATSQPDSRQNQSKKFLEHDHNELVFKLLDELSVSESNATNKLEKLYRDGYLDNIEFSEAFQRSLVFNLLTLETVYENFLSYCVNLFQWEDQTDSRSYFGVAVTNIVNSLKPFRFYEYLLGLTKIKNRNEAQKLSLDWDECYAARILLKKTNIFKLYFISRFMRNKTQVTTGLLTYIVDNYPKLLASKINIQTASWLLDYKYHKGARRFTLFAIAGAIIALVISYLIYR
jgi:hypothetical protein